VKLVTTIRRFLTPAPLVTALAYFRYRAAISPRAEIELSPFLKMGAGVRVSSFVKIKASDGPVVIGARTDIGVGCFIAGHSNGIFIGEDCMIGANSCIVGVNYRYDNLDIPFRTQGVVSNGPIVIGNNVWIGVGTVVLDNCKIGSGVVIAPNSVVSGNIPDNAIVQGNPGKTIFIRR
jgi:acetyltransferase-like isoleucine patch superfamily enzyme